MTRSTKSGRAPRRWRRWTEKDARCVLADWRRSGLSIHAFALERGLHPQRLLRWRQRLPTTIPAAAVPAIRFREILDSPRPELKDSGAAFEIVLRGGRVLRVPASFDPGALRRLLDVVDA
jgi:hypothetical protein